MQHWSITMKLLWLTWKDLRHPQAGGAELVNEELATRLAAEGHEVTLLVGGFKGCKQEEHRNGYRIIRLGNRYSVYWHAFRYYKKHLKGWADIIIEEVNTVPFFSHWYAKEKSILFVHQLAREIWFYQMIFPLSLIGYMIEPVYLRLLSSQEAITVSQSTKDDLVRYGFIPKNVSIISEGINLTPIDNIDSTMKYKKPTLLSLGAIRPMKRALHQIEAFEILKKWLPDCKLKIAGDSSGGYGKRVLRRISTSPFADDISYEGVVSSQRRLELMQKCHLIMVTSVKEGWGLIVTEAASQGTPAVVYDVDGLRDSVQHQKTGIVTLKNTPSALARNILGMLKNKVAYDEMSKQAYDWSKSINFNQCYKDFIGAVSK